MDVLLAIYGISVGAVIVMLNIILLMVMFMPAGMRLYAEHLFLFEICIALISLVWPISLPVMWFILYRVKR